MNICILTVWSLTGPVPQLRTASITPGFKMPTWCAFVGRPSPLQPPVLKNSWLTSSGGESRWPPSTKFSCGPTRARHKPPPAPPSQMCQFHPPHLSHSENRLPNTCRWDLKGRGDFLRQDFGLQGGVVPSGLSCWTQEIYRDITSFSFLVLKENLKDCFQTGGNSYKLQEPDCIFLYGGPCSYKAGCCLQVSTSRFVTLHTFWINYFLSYCKLYND